MDIPTQGNNENIDLPPPQSDQIDNPAPYAVPYSINQPLVYPIQPPEQNQIGMYYQQNNYNMQVPLNNGPYPNNIIQVQSPPQNNNDFSACCMAVCRGCCGAIIGITICMLLVFGLLFLWFSQLDFSEDDDKDYYDD